MERQRMWRSGLCGDDIARAAFREETIGIWQVKWYAGDTERWIHRLIPHLRPWLARTHGEVDYYLTQFLTGHGMFYDYLHCMGLKKSPQCVYGVEVFDTV